MVKIDVNWADLSLVDAGRITSLTGSYQSAQKSIPMGIRVATRYHGEEPDNENLQDELRSLHTYLVEGLPVPRYLDYGTVKGLEASHAYHPVSMSNGAEVVNGSGWYAIELIDGPSLGPQVMLEALQKYGNSPIEQVIRFADILERRFRSVRGLKPENLALAGNKLVHTRPMELPRKPDKIDFRYLEIYSSDLIAVLGFLPAPTPLQGNPGFFDRFSINFGTSEYSESSRDLLSRISNGQIKHFKDLERPILTRVLPDIMKSLGYEMDRRKRVYVRSEDPESAP